MKKTNKTLIKYCNVLIAGILTLLGFTTSCENTEPVEYGTPHAKFILNGKIENANTNKAIENIQVVMEYDTSYSDSEGNYRLEIEAFPDENQILDLSVKDVDGEKNGTYQDLDTIAKFKDAEFIKGDGDWYKGETTKKMDIKLTPKK